MRRWRAAQHKRIEQEIDEELQFHLAMRTEANVADGMTRDDARRAAVRSLGDVAAIKREGSEILAGGTPAASAPSLVNRQSCHARHAHRDRMR
jgi:hypothetical protein